MSIKRAIFACIKTFTVPISYPFCHHERRKKSLPQFPSKAQGNPIFRFFSCCFSWDSVQVRHEVASSRRCGWYLLKIKCSKAEFPLQLKWSERCVWIFTNEYTAGITVALHHKHVDMQGLIYFICKLLRFVLKMHTTLTVQNVLELS